MDAPGNLKIKLENEDMDYETADEANNLLRNGILVETSKGLVCMSLNDALSSDLNLSVEDLRNVAAQLISQQELSSKDRILPQTTTNFDSDGFSSECSDISTTTSSSSVHSKFLTFSSLNNEFHPEIFNYEHQFENIVNKPKIISVSSVKLDVKTSGESSSKNQNVNITEKTNVIENILTSNSKRVEPSTSVEKNIVLDKPKKGRGGWPKGRKRKPELLNLPPKAPATGYTLYLNEQRKLFKDSSLPFHEVTKIIGNRWSSLTLVEKKPYLDKAEEDKKRYREELKQYRQSDAYRAYLAKKRKNRIQNNVLSESDMDATDEIDEEDNEELYCRTCDQWFHNLHNKREHLQGKQHFQSVAGDIKRELGSETKNICLVSADNVDKANNASNACTIGINNSIPSTIQDAMANLISIVSSRNSEIKELQKRSKESVSKQQALCRQVFLLTEKYNKLKKDLSLLQETEKDMESRVFHLWQVPSLFIVTDFNSDLASEYDGTE